MHLIRLAIICAVIFCNKSLAKTSGLVEAEICFDTDVNITCPRNHVILMEQAMFGRMRIGKCIQKDKNIGCKVDVLAEMHQICSGRPSCVGRVPYRDFQNKLTCLDERLGFTTVLYKCVEVVPTGRNPCQRHKPITIKDTEGYISSLMLQGQQPSPSNCTFEISAPRGQTVLLTYLNFQLAKTSRRKSSNCDVYTEDYSRRSPFCEVHYNKNVFHSKGNHIYIDLKQPSNNEVHYFIIKYEAVGCKDPNIPSNTWFQREEAGVMVKCNHTNQRWHLVCRDNKWVGSMDNCTSGPSDKNGIVQKRDMFPFSLLIAVLVGIFIGILLGVALLCTASCVLKHRRNSKNYYTTSNISQGPNHSFMLHGKAHPFDHNYECTTTQQPSTQLPSQGLMGFTATMEEECNPNCPYNSITRSSEQRGKCTGRQQTGVRLWQETPSIIRDSEGDLLQSHYWDNTSTTCVCPGTEETPTRSQGQRSIHNSLDKSNEDTLNQIPSLNQQISALR